MEGVVLTVATRGLTAVTLLVGRLFAFVVPRRHRLLGDLGLGIPVLLAVRHTPCWTDVEVSVVYYPTQYVRWHIQRDEQKGKTQVEGRGTTTLVVAF